MNLSEGLGARYLSIPTTNAHEQFPATVLSNAARCCDRDQQGGKNTNEADFQRDRSDRDRVKHTALWIDFTSRHQRQDGKRSDEYIAAIKPQQSALHAAACAWGSRIIRRSSPKPIQVRKRNAI